MCRGITDHKLSVTIVKNGIRYLCITKKNYKYYKLRTFYAFFYLLFYLNQAGSVVRFAHSNSLNQEHLPIFCETPCRVSNIVSVHRLSYRCVTILPVTLLKCIYFKG